jgi:MFS superfamily sulfate permease-like transporter
LQVKRVEVPANLAQAIDWLKPADLLSLADPTLLIAAFAVAFIASAETLLSAAAVDRMHSGVRSDFDRELSAQGVGNMLCGLLGALPMTGVIVRSSANVQAGATTRYSTIFHGLWLLAFVLLLSSVLQSIPVASLAGVLVYTGFKLVDLKAFRGLGRYGRMPMFTYAATALAIIFTDLLTGVLIGFGLTMVKLALKASRLKISLIDLPQDGEMELRLAGAATFLKVPALTQVLGSIPAGATVHVPLNNLSYIDHSCLELLEEWGRANAAKGSKLLIESRGLKRRLEGRVRTTGSRFSSGLNDNPLWERACSRWRCTRNYLMLNASPESRAGSLPQVLYFGSSQRLIQLQAHTQAAGHARPAFPRGTGVRAAELLAVGFYRFQSKALFVEHLVDGVMHRLIQLVSEFLTNQLVGNQIGDSHVQGDQWLAEMLDVQVVDLFDKPMREIGFVQQAVEPNVPGHDCGRLEEVLLGDFQHRFDL